jgi:hypothetical protein
MIISHKHKYVHIHIPKTAGSSISAAIPGKHRDIVGKVDSTYYKDPLLYWLTPLQHWKYRDVETYLWEEGEDITDYFTFTFVRNPWARAVSHYFYALQVNPGEGRTKAGVYQIIEKECPTFRDFCIKAQNHSLTKVYGGDQQLNFIQNSKGTVAIDFIGKVENIDQDWKAICKKTNIWPGNLQVKNSSKHEHYTQYYDEETKEIIRKLFQADIEYFNYKFE